MEEFIGADPITFDHALLFKKLQSFSLEWRLQDPYSSLVSAKEPVFICEHAAQRVLMLSDALLCSLFFPEQITGTFAVLVFCLF